MVDGAFGLAKDPCYFGLLHSVQIKQDQGFVVRLEARYQFIQSLGKRAVVDIGYLGRQKRVGEAVVVPRQMPSFMREYCIQGNPVDPGAGAAFVVEPGIARPQIVDNFLIQVLSQVDILARICYTEAQNCATAVVQYLQKLSMFFVSCHFVLP